MIRRLRAAGFEALLAGGCVRDMLLGRRSADYDVATNATPDEVSRLFRKVLLIGARFGVAMIIHRGRKIEVTTFRSDLSYSDGRHPDSVRFSTPQEDAKRRDFTINGMFCDPVSGKIIDYVGGRADLERRVIRTIGSPADRFAEDYLRMIRAVRFAVRLDFRIARTTADAIRADAPKIAGISGERIFDELSRMFSLASAPAAMKLMHKLGLAGTILPDLLADDDTWREAVEYLEAVAGRCDLVLSLGALLGRLTKRRIHGILRHWGASNDLRDALVWLAEHRDQWPAAATMPLVDFKRILANPNFHRLRQLWSVQERRTTGRSICTRRIGQWAKSIPSDRIAPAPLITGEDLKKMGLREGRKLGRILRAVYDAQLNEQVCARTDALKLARRLKSPTGR